MPRRYRQTMKGTFFGDFVYDQVIPPSHFLVQLDKVINWEPYTATLVESYKGKAERGEVPYNPVMVLKMLLVAYLYGMSERQAEDFCTYYLPAKAFIGLGVTDPAPDHPGLPGQAAPCACSGCGYSRMAEQRPTRSCST